MATDAMITIRDLLAERDAAVRDADKLREALGDDAAGRPFAETLSLAADWLDREGGGPLADCLRQKSEQVARAALGAER